MSSNEQPGMPDPENRLFSRAPVRERLDAESLRDAILATAGTLDPQSADLQSRWMTTTGAAPFTPRSADPNLTGRWPCLIFPIRMQRRNNGS